ncbi:MAG: hypothetical protein HEEMFOPI_01338 [Holosporales bacterium]
MNMALKDPFVDISVDISCPADISSILKKRREELKLTIADVSESIKIRGEHLNFIENDLFHKLPGKVYAIGFVRTYSAYLGLNENLIVERMRLLPEYSEVATIIKASAVVEKSKTVPVSAILFACLVLVGFIYFLSGNQVQKQQMVVVSSDVEKKSESVSVENSSEDSDKKEIAFN